MQKLPSLHCTCTIWWWWIFLWLCTQSSSWFRSQCFLLIMFSVCCMKYWIIFDFVYLFVYFNWFLRVDWANSTSTHTHTHAYPTWYRHFHSYFRSSLLKRRVLFVHASIQRKWTKIKHFEQCWRRSWMRHVSLSASGADFYFIFRRIDLTFVVVEWGDIGIGCQANRAGNVFHTCVLFWFINLSNLLIFGSPTKHTCEHTKHCWKN